MFFMVLWRGLCQALGWFFGLFGYKRDGKFAKCVWGLFATSGSIVMTLFALALLCCIGESVYNRWIRNHYCDDKYCYHSEYVNRDIYFHNTEDGKGYIYNIRTGEKYLKHVAWIAKPTDKDSLICFSDGKKRGYFSKNTGKVVIDKKMAYIPNMEGYVFHGGYCVVDTDDGEQCGLMDKKGNIVLPLEYSSIHPSNDFKYWRLQKGEEMAVLDSNLKPILPLSECSINIGDGTIDVTLSDHTMRKYDMEGTLINDFYIASVRMLEYEKEEIIYRDNVVNKVDDELTEILEESYHPKATARLRAYVAGDGYEGLMTADGHKVTMPLYWEIEALDHDLYLCATKNGDKVIVNSKGEIVR